MTRRDEDVVEELREGDSVSKYIQQRLPNCSVVVCRIVDNMMTANAKACVLHGRHDQ
jgi:hypothetical protein